MCTRNPDDNTAANAAAGDPDTTNTTAATRESKIAQFLVEVGISLPSMELPRQGGPEEDCWTSDCFCVDTLVLGMRCPACNKPHYPHCTPREAGVVKSTVVAVREQRPGRKTKEAPTADEPNNLSPSTSGSTSTCSSSTTVTSTRSSKGKSRTEKKPAKRDGKERGGGGTERRLPVGQPGYKPGQSKAQSTGR